MNKKPLVSVIVPNYNYARFLEQRMETLLCQTYKNIEVILLDDASTDESLEIIKLYQHNSRVSHVEINTCNSGTPFIQWANGLALARGKYVWIAESDDYSELSFLDMVVPLMEENEDAALCFVGSFCVDEFGNKIGIDHDRWGKKQYSCKKGYKVFNGNDYLLYNMYWHCYIYNASGVLFRRDFAETVDKTKYCSMRSSGDWLFWIEMMRQGKVIEIYKKLNFFRYHQSTSMKAKKAGIALEEDFEIIKQMEKYLPQLTFYKRTLRRGVFYKKIKRADVDPMIRLSLFNRLKEDLGGGFGAYVIERINRYLSFFLPCLCTEQRERL